MEDIKSEFASARLAMAVDCEGSISIVKCKDSRRHNGFQYYTQITVSNTCEELIDWIVSNFGFSKRPTKSYSEKHKPSYMAYITRAKSEDILWQIRPYLIIKGDLAELALDLRDTMSRKLGRCIVPDGILAERERLWLAAKKLNQRGRHPK